MATLELVLLLIAAVLVSALVSQISSKISTPLFQILVGIVIALFIQTPVEVSLDPELFLVLFIAPLLFCEANKIDRMGFWKNRGMILSLAIGLVIATTLVVGFAVNIIVPSVSLAAAFALGAALAPTDAVAVSSMAGTASLTQKQKTILAGESLINDASGLVAFQFAIAAAVTGTFSLVDASVDFLILFFGGIALGIALGVVYNWFVVFCRNCGLDNSTFHVLFEVAAPFMTYIIGETAGVSGILAVVACAIVFSLSHNQAGPGISKMNIVSSSVWDVLTFALNGIVFVLLGMMLPGGMMTELTEEVSTVNFSLLGIALLVAFIVIGVRFLWTILIERFFGAKDEIDKGLVKYAAILAFSGTKGAVTLSIAMTIPLAVEGRSDMIFICSAVILIMLLLANFIVPVLAPATADDADTSAKKSRKAYTKVLRRVIEHLTDDADDTNGFERMAYTTVIEEYSKRVFEIQSSGEINTKTEMTELRIQALEWQKEYANSLRDTDSFPVKVINKFVKECDHKLDRLRSRQNKVTVIAMSFSSRIAQAFRLTMKSFGVTKLRSKYLKGDEYRQLKMKAESYVIGCLAEHAASADSDWQPESLSALMTEYQKKLTSNSTTTPSVTQMIRTSELTDKVRLKGLAYEREFIDDAYSGGEIDRISANELRRKVSTMALDLEGEL